VAYDANVFSVSCLIQYSIQKIIITLYYVIYCFDCDFVIHRRFWGHVHTSGHCLSWLYFSWTGLYAEEIILC